MGSRTSMAPGTTSRDPTKRAENPTAARRGLSEMPQSHQVVLMNLQRTAGNAAVARLMAQRATALRAPARPSTTGPDPQHNGVREKPPPAAASYSVQRKVGFEAELMVPSLGSTYGSLKFSTQKLRPTDKIRSFPDGGVPYGTDMGGKGGPIRLDSDHSSQISRAEIIEELKKHGYIKGGVREP